MFIGSMGLCISDVVCDSILVTHARLETEDTTGSIQSWSWGLRAVGGLLASVSGGFAYTYMGSELVQVTTGVFPLLVSLLFMLIHEPPSTEKKDVSDTFKLLVSAFRNQTIWKPALFLFIIGVTPGFGAVSTYYFENELKFTAGDFSMLDTTSYITSIVGTILYKKYLTKVPFRTIFFWTLALSWLLKWSYISIVTGANESVGLPNIVLAMADSIILSLLGQFLLLPTVVLAAKICPAGVEGSLYATLMSVSNMAGVLSSEWGSVFANMYGVNQGHYENFWKLIVLCNVLDLIPIASIVLIKEPPINQISVT
jgi:hypothetical protein